jgi:hypothetical protein
MTKKNGIAQFRKHSSQKSWFLTMDAKNHALEAESNAWEAIASQLFNPFNYNT